MRHHDQAATPALQIVLQPRCHRVIQVVRRLIQHKDVTGLHQDFCQCQTFALTAGELRDFLFQPDNPQCPEHTLCLTFHIPLCTLGYFFLHMFPHRAGIVKFRCLRQITDHNMICFCTTSGIRLFQASRKFQQRGLAGSVDPDDADLLALLKKKRCTIQQHPLRICFCNIFQ